MIKIPQILYWLYNTNTEKGENIEGYVNDIAEYNFNTIILTDRGVNFYNYEDRKPHFKKLVESAKSKNLTTCLQVWPKGFINRFDVDEEKAQAMVTEAEFSLNNEGYGQCILQSDAVRSKGIAYPICTKLLFAYAFQKYADGVYYLESIVDVTNEITINNLNSVDRRLC